MSDTKSPAEIIMTQQSAVEEQLTRMRDALSDRNLREVAKRTGLHENTIHKFVKGKVAYPTPETRQKLSDYLFPVNA